MTLGKMNLPWTNFEVSEKELKKFGLLMSVLMPLFVGLCQKNLTWWHLLISAAFLLLAFTSNLNFLLKIFYQVWMNLGHTLGMINSKIIFCTLYVIFFIPVGIYSRIRGLDRLHEKWDPNLPSYLVKKNSPFDKKSMERMF